MLESRATSRLGRSDNDPRVREVFAYRYVVVTHATAAGDLTKVAMHDQFRRLVLLLLSLHLGPPNPMSLGAVNWATLPSAPPNRGVRAGRVAILDPRCEFLGVKNWEHESQIRDNS